MSDYSTDGVSATSAAVSYVDVPAGTSSIAVESGCAYRVSSSPSGLSYYTVSPAHSGKTECYFRNDAGTVFELRRHTGWHDVLGILSPGHTYRLEFSYDGSAYSAVSFGEYFGVIRQSSASIPPSDDPGDADMAEHIARRDNPHNVTLAQLGLRVDSAVTAGSANLIQSGAVAAALANATVSTVAPAPGEDGKAADAASTYSQISQRVVMVSVGGGVWELSSDVVNGNNILFGGD